MKTKLYWLSALFCLFFQANAVSAQDNPIEITKNDSIVKSAWIFNLGFNAVDDSGSEFGNLFAVEERWNIVPFPSRLAIGKFFDSGLGLQFIGTYNQYQEGKIVDGNIVADNIDYLGLDALVSYDLNKIIGETGFFDPYIGVGGGYTDANNLGRGTFNTTVGFKIWFSDRFGIDLNSTGKFALNQDATNHIQHGAAVNYRFGAESGLSKKGEEKLQQLRLLEEERQRTQDSIAAAQRAEEEVKALAARLQKEKEEAEQLAAEEAKASIEKAENERKQKIQAEINGLGSVYFNLNSSYLTKNDKALITKLVDILKANPNVIMKVTSHTDSRGSAKYNQWLSERRLQRTIDYLVSLGIDSSRLQREALGETQLTNDCRDAVPCAEHQHKENRRSEFIVVSQ